jgi:hypothetical protein
MKVQALLALLFLAALVTQAQTVISFEGINVSELTKQQLDIDPNGAVGTKQYVEWVNNYFQAFDKTTLVPLASPEPGTLPFRNNGISNCYAFGGDGIVNFDRVASRWIIAGHGLPSPGQYYYCVAISSTDDLSSQTLQWYTYQFYLNPCITNSNGYTYFPDWPKFGTWGNAYYVAFDLLDTNNKYIPIGIGAVALDRANMLNNGTPHHMQCFTVPRTLPIKGSYSLYHSLIPADVEGTTPPPANRDEFMVSIQNPPRDKNSTTSTSINLWDFHVDWVNPANSTFTRSSLTVPVYTPGCYNPGRTDDTWCVPEPSTLSNGYHYDIDSVGDRLMPRLAYRNFGTYESFLVSHTVRTGIKSKQTGIRWYELHSHGKGHPTLFQSGTVSPDHNNFRFMPSIAQDKDGNAAVGYSTSSLTAHPGISASWWNLPNSTGPTELLIQRGSGDALNSVQWGDYTGMTVDPVDGCTFWYVNEYFTQNQNTTLDWQTRIAKFKVPTCGAK